MLLVLDRVKVKNIADFGNAVKSLGGTLQGGELQMGIGFD